ncbi:MAG: metallophosphoesterase family protein [Planctomycetota bacterium]|nr:metallophosphoesterase family protein [Planctomycetota bacterium]MDA1180517.1 metallophosphoesterase family protein [Planctomycetota bacterium]
MGTKRAVLSDIHGNLEALEAVLTDVAQQGVTQVVCLGDIVGYGPNPCECVDRIMECDVCVLGNHDQGALFDPEGFSSGAERAVFWTRKQLENSEDAARNTQRWKFLCGLPRVYREPEFMFVHGSARNPLQEYVFPEDVHNPGKIERIFAMIPHICLQGHTHVPGVFTEDRRFSSPQQLNGLFQMTPGKAMVNVGSVGQPRDGDPRSCYVLLSDETVEFRRVDYPREKTIAKILGNPDLDDFLGLRLRDGR